MSDKAKVIGVVSAILGLLAAGLVLLTRHQEFKKSSAEADVAEQRRRAELDELKARSRNTVPPAETRPSPEKAVPPARNPAPPKKSASELFVPSAVWEGNSGGYKMRMEVKAVRDGAMTGKLHWWSGGALVMTARMTGRVVDPDQVSFQWQAADIEFGGGFAPTAYGGTINPVDGGLRGTWGALGGPLTGGSFSLERLP